MTMLYGFASKQEQYPLSRIGEGFSVGAASLDLDKRRFIVEGEGGTVFGISFAVDQNQSTDLFKTRNSHQLIDQKFGNRATLKLTNSLGSTKWVTLRGRVTQPESVQKVIDAFDLDDLLVRGVLGIVTCRDKVIDYSRVDSSAPVESLSGFTIGTVGQITMMIRQMKQLGISVGSMDGRQVGRKVGENINHAHGDIYTSAMVERLFLKKTFGVLPFALHWILLDQDLQFVHALHSQEPNGVKRAKPYLFIAKNSSNTVVFASKSEMMANGFGNLNTEAPNSGEVYTRFT